MEPRRLRGPSAVVLLPIVPIVSDYLLFAALVLPAVQAQPDAFDQPLGLVAVQRDELGSATGAGVRVERPRLLLVEVGRAQHVVLDDADESAADRPGTGRQHELRTH